MPKKKRTLLRKLLIGTPCLALRGIQGACSLAYKTGSLVAKGISLAAKYGADYYEASQAAEDLQKLRNGARKLTQDINAELEQAKTGYRVNITPQMLANEIATRQYEEVLGAHLRASELLQGINLENYL